MKNQINNLEEDKRTGNIIPALSVLLVLVSRDSQFDPYVQISLIRAVVANQTTPMSQHSNHVPELLEALCSTTLSNVDVRPFTVE
ncbi:MAG TPA: hypothetical protein VFI73_03205 [Candidatus Nitrosopolaris sp.]|nr:hypothetical protein [Candidatus Nitrosopolaris sp.]